MSLKHIASLFLALLTGYFVSPSYSGDVIFCDGFECAAGDPALEARVAALEALLADVYRLNDPNTGQDTLRFEAMNVQIVNGIGITTSDNGIGNLIIGYNETRDESAAVEICPSNAESEYWCNRRHGSHNLVIGNHHNYSTYGGIVAGSGNEISGQQSSVLGGFKNLAISPFSVVTGGFSNTASGDTSTISGGAGNTASGNYSSVSGGQSNEAAWDYSSVSGGFDNSANTSWTSISGGSGNIAGGEYSSISGGKDNHAGGEYSSVSGGNEKNALATHCWEGDSVEDC